MRENFGKEIPKLGFGLMRLPVLEGTQDIDIEQTKKMVDIFMNAGFTYFDTAFTYGGGASERAAKEALVDRYPRESFQLATKLFAHAAKSEKEAKQQLITSLERTGAGYIDFYLLHDLEVDTIETYEKWHLWDYVKEMKEKGLIKHYGFSFHAKPENLDEVLTKHPDAEFVQLQINYADWEEARVESRACYEIARKHKKPIVVMEPVKGGMLSDPPEAVAKILKAADPKASAASWAIRFAASQEGVLTVLSGMSNLAQMEDNVSFMKDFKPLDEEEMKVIAAARAELMKIDSIQCTGCKYCVAGCPMNINIPGTFRAMNAIKVFGDEKMARGNYSFAVSLTGGKASDCIACGQCEGVCPQHLPIIQLLGDCAEIFD